VQVFPYDCMAVGDAPPGWDFRTQLDCKAAAFSISMMTLLISITITGVARVGLGPYGPPAQVAPLIASKSSLDWGEKTIDLVRTLTLDSSAYADRPMCMTIRPWCCECSVMWARRADSGEGQQPREGHAHGPGPEGSEEG
jgi:hypothetical protein